MKTLWVIVRAINAYDQEGEYFYSVFTSKPSREQLLKLFYLSTGENKNYSKEQHKFVGHLLEGGGRIYPEHEWFYLTEIKEGTEYQNKNY